MVDSPLLPPATATGNHQQSAFPQELPQDRLQPWETVDRAAAAVDRNSDFTAGRDWFLGSTSGISENGEAARLSSGPGTTAYGIWRIPLGGAQPGTLSVDANLLDNGSNPASVFFVGLADYGNGRWSWHGPFDDSHVRISLAGDVRAGSNFLSGVQNTFVCVLTSKGDSIDVVGIGLNPLDPADSTAPSAVEGLTVTAVSGGLELQWLPVIAADLAGYRVHYASRSFINPESAGVRSVDYLEGSTRFLLGGLGGKTFVRISALDHSGNSSPSGKQISAVPLPGDALEISLTTDLVSGPLGSSAMLTASGAASYDFDTNGDGIFDVTGDTSGTAGVDTSATGIIRPRVRASDATGEAVALGAVSLIISGNSRPLASATADPQSGSAPLGVTFTGLAEDAEDDDSSLSYAWDFDGDGIYEAGTDSLTPAEQTYSLSGIFNAKFRVTDSEGASDVDTVAINVSSGINAVLEIHPNSVEAGEFVTLNAGASTSAGTIVQYEWDTDGDGSFETDTGVQSSLVQSYPDQGIYNIGLRITDDAALSDTALASVLVRGWTQPQILDDSSNGTGFFPNISVVNGNPAIVYTDLVDDSLMYIRALDPQGTAWGTAEVVAILGNFPFFAELEIVNGNPAVIFGQLNETEIYYSRAFDQNGIGWNAHQTIAPGNGTSPHSLAIVDGRPAVAFRGTGSELSFVRATDASGDAWGAPVIIDATANYNFISMAVADGNPAISCQNDDTDTLVYVRAADSTGASWGSIETVDGDLMVGLWSDLRIINGNPAISYVDDDNDILRFVRAVDSTGSSWGNPVLLWPLERTNGAPALDIVHGNPAICFRSDENLLAYTRAVDSAGTVWNTPVFLHTAVSSQWPTMTTVNGSPALAHLTDNASLGFVNYLP